MTIDPKTLAAILKVSEFAVKQVQSHIKSRRVRTLEQFTKELQRHLLGLDRKCDPERFVDLANKAALSLAVDSREFKRKLFVSVLVGAYQEPGEAAIGAFFTTLIERFDTRHCAVLACMVNAKGLDTGRTGDKTPAVGFQFVLDSLAKQLELPPAECADLCTATINELIDAGLLHTRQQASSDGKQIIGINPVGLLRKMVYSLSPLGRAFVLHLVDSELCPPINESEAR